MFFLQPGHNSCHCINTPALPDPHTRRETLDYMRADIERLRSVTDLVSSSAQSMRQCLVLRTIAGRTQILFIDLSAQYQDFRAVLGLDGSDAGAGS